MLSGTGQGAGAAEARCSQALRHPPPLLVSLLPQQGLQLIGADASTRQPSAAGEHTRLCLDWWPTGESALLFL